MIDVASAHHGDDEAVDAVIQSAAALYYLVNPFDAIYDFYEDIGFEDDIRRIKQVHVSVVNLSQGPRSLKKNPATNVQGR